MKRLVLIALIAGLVAQPAGLSGQLAPIPGSQEYLRFVGAGNAQVATWGGVMLGPYTAQFLAGPNGAPTSPQFSIYCVDYSHNAGDQWINSTNLGGTAPIGPGTTRRPFAQYQRLAYLSSLFDSNALSQQYAGASQRTIWSGIHAAIWSLTDGQSLGTGLTATIRDDLLNGQFHLAAAASYNTDGWYVLTPDFNRGYNGQEFLVRTAVVPEPAAFLLMATGLLILAAFSRRRLRSVAGEV